MTDKKQTKPPPPPPKRHKGGAVMRIITAALLAATVSALVPAAGPIVPTPEWRVTESARAGAERDYRFLEENCPSLFGRYGGDVESVEIYAPAMYFPANVPATSIRVKLREDLKRVPATLRAWGHALEYFVRSDGISVQKDQSWQVCNWSAVAPSGHDAFYPFVKLSESLAGRGDRERDRMAQSFMVIAGHYEDAARLLEDGKVGGSADALERAFGAVKDTADWMGSSGTLSLDPSVAGDVSASMRGKVARTQATLSQCAGRLDFGCVMDSARVLAEEYGRLGRRIAGRN